MTWLSKYGIKIQKLSIHYTLECACTQQQIVTVLGKLPYLGKTTLDESHPGELIHSQATNDPCGNHPPQQLKLSKLPLFASQSSLLQRSSAMALSSALFRSWTGSSTVAASALGTTLTSPVCATLSLVIVLHYFFFW